MSEPIKAMDLESVGEQAQTQDLPPGRLRALEYLRGLNEDEYIKQALAYGVYGVVQVEAFTDWTPDSCIQCLSTFMDEGIWPGHMFNCGHIWSIYLKSLAEERYHQALDLICELSGPVELMVYLRAMYKFGLSVIPDQAYDVLEDLYIKVYPHLSFLTELTNDDLNGLINSTVSEAIKLSTPRSSRASDAPTVTPQSGMYASLNAEKSTSVKPVRSYEEAFDYLRSAPRVRTHWSLKVDGINTKCLFKEDGTGLELAISRGRAADSWDYSEAIRRVIDAQGINPEKLKGKITGESMVDPSALEELRRKYPGKDYKSPKSTAGAMLRAPQQFDVEDYKHLKFFPFTYEGVLKDEAFDVFRGAGFVPPPARIFESYEVPLGSLEEFSAWLDKEVLDPLWEKGLEMDIGSDGVVLQLLTDEESDRADKYSDLNIALKFSHWTEADYTSRVVDIEFEQRRVEVSIVLIVEPVTTRDLNVATRVSVGSPAILVADGVKIGDTITFTRKSEAINVYLRKE